MRGSTQAGLRGASLATEPLFDEPMSMLVSPDPTMSSSGVPSYGRALAAQPWVVTPPGLHRNQLSRCSTGASSIPGGYHRVPASFLVTLTFIAVAVRGSVARSVARHLERRRPRESRWYQGADRLPPVGIVAMRETGSTRRACEQLVENASGRPLS